MTKTALKNSTETTFHKKALLILSELKKDRDIVVVKERFGLDSKPKTLESIGSSLKITRERVRQIERSSVAKLSKSALNQKEMLDFFKNIDKTIKYFGGAVSEDRFVAYFIPTKKQDEVEIRSLVLLTIIHPSIKRFSETKNMRAFLIDGNISSKKIFEISNKIDELLGKKRVVLTSAKIAMEIKEDQILTESVLWIKKNVLETDEKKWGLTTWREVNPKSIKDKTYLILKKHSKPLHYSELAKKISEHKLQKRPVTKQAVHNELIRDPRFVLIGRGIYALSDWGYRPGVVEDVIREILSENGGPMHKNDIIEKVKERRIVKETTIILNLQKDSFKRVSRATYTLKVK